VRFDSLRYRTHFNPFNTFHPSISITSTQVKGVIKYRYRNRYVHLTKAYFFCILAVYNI